MDLTKNMTIERNGSVLKTVNEEFFLRIKQETYIGNRLSEMI